MHAELKKKLDTVNGLTWVEGTPNATIAAANNTMDAKTLEDLIRVGKVCGYTVSLAAGVLTFAPK